MKHLKLFLTSIFIYLGGVINVFAAENFTALSAEGKLIEYSIEYSSAIVAASSTINQAIEGALTIPDVVEYNGYEYPVTKIGTEAFKGNTRLTSVTIGNNVTTINQGAFEGCTNLASVTFGTGLVRIEKNGFHQCTSLTSVQFPEGLKSFGQYAFCSSGLSCDIVIPSSVLNIEEQAFAWTSITSVRLQSNATIKAGAFYYCDSITAYYFSPTVLQPIINHSSSYGYPVTINNGTKIYVSQGTISMLKNGWFQSGHIFQSMYNSAPSTFVAYESIEGSVFMNQIDVSNGEGTNVGSLALCFTVTSSDENNRTAALYCPPSTGYVATDILKSGANAVIKNNLTADGKLVIPETVTDGQGKTYTVTEIGAGAFGEYATNYYNHISGLKFPNTITHIGVKAFRYLQYLSGNLIIPASVSQIGHPDVDRAELFYQDQYGEVKVPGVYMMHTSASDIDWYETQAYYYFAYDYSGTNTTLNVCQEIYDKAYGYNGATRYPSKSAFWSWHYSSNWQGNSYQVKLFDPSTYGLQWNTAQTIVDISGEYEAPDLLNPFGLMVTYSSSNPGVAAIDETTGEITLGTAEGSTTLTATFAGNDEYTTSVSVQTVILRRGEPMMAEDQENHNEWNTCEALTKVTRWTPNPELYQEYNMWAMPHMMDGQFYVSAFWQSNNSSTESESFYWNDITYDYKHLQLSCSPALLSPNYGSYYDEYGHDNMAGSTFGGFICFKVKGPGTIIVRGFTESDNAKMGICVQGNTPLLFSGAEDREISYDYTLDAEAEAYAYVYGASLSPTRHGYIRYIKFIPEGTVMADVSVGGIAIEEESDDVLGDGGSVGFEWREDEEGGEDIGGGEVKRFIGGDPEGGDDGNEYPAVPNRYPVLILNNANLTSENGPAIEVNSHDRFLIELRGHNTITTSSGNAAISMGTLQETDWGGGTIRIVGLEEGASLTIPAVEGVESGIYLAESSIMVENFSGDISGTDYGIRFQGYDSQDYNNDANCNMYLGQGMSLKMHGSEAALSDFNPQSMYNLGYYDEEADEWKEYVLLDSDIEGAKVVWSEDGVAYGIEEEKWVADPDDPDEGQWEYSITPAKYLLFGIYPEAIHLNLSSADLVTLCSKYPLDFAEVEGLKAYIITGFKPSESKLVLTRADEAPAGMPLLIYRTGSTTEFSIPVVETDMYYGENLLKPGPAEIQATDGDKSNFILTYDPNDTSADRKIGFYTFNDTRTIPEGKAYLQIPTSSLPSSVKGFSIVFTDDEPTAIAEIGDGTGKAQDTVIYDITGRRLSKTQKGVNIVDGKKVMVK